MRPFGHGAADFLINGRAAPNMKKVIRMLCVFFFLRLPSSTQAVGFLFARPLPPIHPQDTRTTTTPCLRNKETHKEAKEEQTKTQSDPISKKPSLEKSKIFNLENDKEPLDFPIPGALNKDRDVQPSLRARSSPSVLLWTGYKNPTASEPQRPHFETIANRIFTLQ